MTTHPAYELLREQTIPEIASVARMYRHKKTGAEVLSLVNDDENKVFGVTFKTPPSDSTGVAHILEHSVLCGSRKYPVKKPFVEMLKGSLHTFLNAMTFPDKTAYPVASQNLQDFYNLVDVYLDAVYFPLITEDTFRQEGWHFEADNKNDPLVYKGVVFNEMKGVYSSPEAVLRETAQRSLYPDTTYGQNSGGDPKVIPELTYKDFKNFHAKFYHPSNTRAFFYGDDDPAQRLVILDEYLSEFEPIPVTSEVGLQARFNAPRQITRTYAGGRDDGSDRTGLISLQWMLDEIPDPAEILGLNLLEYIVLGTSAAPLRKALTDSGLGEGFAGGGISESYRQPMFSVALKGLVETDGGKVEALILDTLRELANGGIEADMIEAGVNSLEFSMRENNTGSFPRGISLMFRSLSTWLHGGDPFDPLAFEGPLANVKAAIAADPNYFGNLITKHLLENEHRTTVLLTADKAQAERDAAEEKARLDMAEGGLDEAGRQNVVDITNKLKELQTSVDAPEDLAKIPTLHLADLPRHGKSIPLERLDLGHVPVYYHDLATNGVIYLDIGFDLKTVPVDLLPYLPLFSRALFQTGTSKEDFVSLSRRIGRTTGGVGPSRWVSTKADGEDTAAWMFLRGKATPEHAHDLLSILTDVITDARLDNKERLYQMALEEKAGFEGRLSNSGNSLVNSRLTASLTLANWVNEQTGGISYLLFLRMLVKEIETSWDGVRAKLEAIRAIVFDRSSALANVTADSIIWSAFAPQLAGFLEDLPQPTTQSAGWSQNLSPRISEGLVIPAKVNFVGKGANLYALGYKPTGATSVANKHLNTTYMWDKVRVEGGAYGGSAGFDPFSGSFVFTSYRDPNLLKTIDAYDGAGAFLANEIGETEITRSIIGVIGAIDSYMLPDAKGFTSLLRHLSGNTDTLRQERREQVLGASLADFRNLGDVLGEVASKGHVVVLGSDTAIEAANAERGGFLTVSRIL
jgi:Zn-dependent M16 (insulinase) family peptidase